MPKRQYTIILNEETEKNNQFEINMLDSLLLKIEVEEVETLDDATVELFFRKPNGIIVSEVITNKNQNIITIDVKNGALDVPGIVVGQIKITESDNTISTFKFRFFVRDTITSDDAELNHMSTSKVSKLLKDVNDAKSLATNNKTLIDAQAEKIDHVKDKRYINYKNNDKAYISIIFDDFRTDLSKVFAIFKEYGLPLVAAVPSNILAKKPNYQESVDLLKEIQDNGGEIMAHGYASGYLTASSTYEDAYREIITSKEELAKCGFNVNGWVRPGGSGALENLNGFQHLVENNYLYASGVESNVSLMHFGGNRIALSSYTSSSEFQTRIQTAIANKEFVIFYGHTLDGTEENLTETLLRECLQYLKNNASRLEVVTLKNYYDKFVEGGNRQERINTEANLKNVGIAIQEINNNLSNSHTFSKNILDPNLITSDGNLNAKWTYNDGGVGSSSKYYLENGSEFRFTFHSTNTSTDGVGTMKLSYTTNKVYIRPGDTFKTGFYTRNLFGTMTVELKIIIKYKNETNEIVELTKTATNADNITLTCYNFVPSKINTEVDYIKYEITVNRPTADTNNSLVYFSLPYLNVINKNNQYGVLL